MNQHLYFVPILAQALKGHDRHESLRVAFETIERLKRVSGCVEGYHNFCRFMREVSSYRQLLQQHDLRMLALERFTCVPSQSKPWDALLSKLLEATPWLNEECSALTQACRPRTDGFILQLLRDDQPIADLTFKTMRGHQFIDDIRPGHYTLKLDTGLVLWEGTLTATDLIWAKAFEGQNLALAAEAGEIRRRPSREMHIPEVGLILRIFPGMEAGALEIELAL